MSDKIQKETFDQISEKIKALAEIFPSAVKNGEVDFEAIKQELGCFEPDDMGKYELTWAGKMRAKADCNPDVNGRALKYIPDDSKNADTTGNYYIEGDNLEVLKLLLDCYRGTVKMIYIDPPYNTGSNFIYSDNFGASKNYSGNFHANWLNMMYPRLFLARRMLRDDGVIFISIGDNEVNNLKTICDEIFGSENFIDYFIWTKTSTPPSLSKKSRKTVEFVLCYEKQLNDSKYYGSELENGDAPLLNSGNPVKKLVFPPGSVKFTFAVDAEFEPKHYDKAELKKTLLIKNGINVNEMILSGEFKWNQENLNNEIKVGTYFIIKSEKFSIRFQRAKNNGRYKTPNNFMDIELNKNTFVGTNESADKELGSLGLGGVFDYPKPVSLLKKLIKMVTNNDKDSIILDFFSGSATTAHAVMQMNAEDGGNRKFIMVQCPEICGKKTEARKAGYKNISEIGKERIRRAGEQIKEKLIKEQRKWPDLNEDILIAPEAMDIGFKVFRTEDAE